jgi:hypothetical protein
VGEGAATSPQVVPDLQVNFRTRSEPDGCLATGADLIPPVPPKPCAWGRRQ